MSAPIMRWVLSFCGLIVLPCAAPALPGLDTGGTTDNQRHEPTRQHNRLEYDAVIESLGQCWHGQVTLVHESWFNGSRLQLTSSFVAPVPSHLALPLSEEARLEGGIVFSSITGPAQPPGRIRVHEYGTFVELAQLAHQLAFAADDQWPASERLYQSRFLWLEKPASIRHWARRRSGDGVRMEMVLSDGSRLHFDFDSKPSGAWRRLHIIRPSATLLYRGATGQEHTAAGASTDLPCGRGFSCARP